MAKVATGNRYSGIAKAVSRVCGRPVVFTLAVGVIAVWLVTGPLFGFSDTWQLVINTGTTIVTFLMVFLIQNTQNRDGAAMQAKLDELVYAVKKADARFIGVEHLTERELDKILEEVEHRAREVHAGKPARAIKGRPAVRAEDVEAPQPKAAPPAVERRPATRSRAKESS